LDVIGNFTDGCFADATVFAEITSLSHHHHETWNIRSGKADVTHFLLDGKQYGSFRIWHTGTWLAFRGCAFSDMAYSASKEWVLVNHCYTFM
jgi:hypothetical protein